MLYSYKKVELFPKYLVELIPTVKIAYITKHKGIPQFDVKYNYLKNSVFPSAIVEWNNFDSK